MVNEQEREFITIKQIVRKYTDPSETKKRKRCGEYYVFDLKNCNLINNLLGALEIFQQDKLTVDVNKYHVSGLLEAYDHMIDIHQFCKPSISETTTESPQQIIKRYFANKLNYCNLKNCSALQNHRMRRRERNKGRGKTKATG
eukprot:21857_1